MKALFFCVVFLSMIGSAEAFFYELVKTGVDSIGKSVDAISEEVFRKTMVAKTMENVAYLQKNFDESKRFYDEMRMIQENPASLGNYTQSEMIR
ncbi:MAG: hypothetical protein QME32_07730, partial [Endomicrobiia bacterium]|nr:hypothetical protein [Endomicrobiia bacterium]